VAVNDARLNAFLGKAVGDLGAAISAVLILLGDKLGWYRALASRPLTSTELASRTGTHERYIREWLANQAAGGYVEYDSATAKYSLNAEQALRLADAHGPVDLPGAYSIVQDLFYIKERALEKFRTGNGIEWGEHHTCLFHGTERFFRAGYNANSISSCLLALEGVVQKLTAGGQPMWVAGTAQARF
jgi:hypothetical protein